MVRALLKRKLIRSAAAISIVLGLCALAHAAPKYKVLHSFVGSDGSGPYTGVILGQDGNLYGTTVGGGTGHCGRYACGTVFRLTPHANGGWTESVLHSFENDGPDGADPYGSLIFDAAGNLYGTTTSGGAHHYGSAFEMVRTPSGWDESVIYSFPLPGGECCPEAGLVMDDAGNLYGTAGAVFELSTASGGWKGKVLHRFTAHDDGSRPSGLILGASGNLYGTTSAGGVHGAGTVFELQKIAGEWKEQRLHNFPAFPKDGQEPSGGVIFDGKGDLYSTTALGGGTGCTLGCGSVYKLTPEAGGHWQETLLHTFGNGQNGSAPDGGVVLDKAGNLYGATAYGGNGCGCGVIYKLRKQPSGRFKYTVLHTFTGQDGAVPAGGLILDDKGNLYGGTVLGGTTGNGVIFELTP
jgi:uncharacterized repeat protein (TIGR03803 family)